MSNKRIRRKREKAEFTRIMASGDSWSYMTTAPAMPSVTIESLLEARETLRMELLKHAFEKYRLPNRFLDSGPVLVDQRICIKSFAE